MWSTYPLFKRTKEEANNTAINWEWRTNAGNNYLNEPPIERTVCYNILAQFFLYIYNTNLYEIIQSFYSLDAHSLFQRTSYKIRMWSWGEVTIWGHVSITIAMLLFSKHYVKQIKFRITTLFIEECHFMIVYHELPI